MDSRGRGPVTRAFAVGAPGALFLHGHERLIGVMALDIAGGQITSISSIVNPDKLAHLGPVADVESLLRSARMTGSN